MKLQRHLMVGLALTAGAVAVGGPTVLLAANPPQIEYVQVLNGANHPRTSFTPGQRVNLKVVVYAPGARASAIEVRWRAAVGHTTVISTSSHSFHGPMRGNLYSQTGGVTLSSHATKGTYVAQATVRVSGKTLSRSARFYVR